MQIKNFYVVKNHAIHDVKTYSFIRYCKRRDGDKAFYLYKSCTRKWMNQGDATRDQSGISILWPDTSISFFNDALTACNSGSSFNNTSAVIRYSLQDGAICLWLVAQFGRASCRTIACHYGQSSVVGVSVKKKKKR